MRQERLGKSYNAIDLLKLVLAVFVMVIHSGADKTISSPLLRTAVPLFFIISSYFFFTKIQKLQSKQDQNAALGKLLKRNLSLYLFWTIVQFPLQFYMRGYHQAGILPGLLQALKNVVLGYGFTGSWFIVALVVGILLVFWLSKKIPSGWLVVLTLPSYILCCLATNYYRISDGVFGARAIINGYQALAGLGINNSFLAALLWVSVGKALADRKWAIKTTMLWVAAGFFAVLLWLEWYLIKRASLCELEDCYFMLMLVCPTIFLLFSRSKLSFVSRVRIRELSTIIYVTHGCCGRILGYALKMLPIPSAVQIGMKMLLSFAAAMVVCQLLVYLREKKNLKIFGYAY